MAEPHIPQVTEKQRTAYDLRAKGQTWEEIGTAMGCAYQTARSHYLGAVKRGLPAVLTEKMFHRPLATNTGEVVRVERMKDGEGMFTGDRREGAPAEFDPRAFTEMAASAGIPPRIANAIARRVSIQFGTAKKEFKRITAAQEVIELEKIRQEILEYMDGVSFAGANAVQLATAYGIIVDKSLLLGGKPTQIFDFNLRAKLEVIMPQFIAEARRRGLTIESTAVRIPEPADVNPGETQE